MPRRPSPSVARRLLATALTVSSVELVSCVESPTFPVDFGDGGVSAAGYLTVHTASTSVPALVTTLTLNLATMEAGSDREPESAPTVTVGAPLSFESDDPVTVPGAVPATYGSVRLAGVTSLTITTTTSNSVVVNFGAVAAIDLRCAGPGTYLPVAGSVNVTVSIDFSLIQNELAVSGYYPPLLPQVVVSNPVHLAALYARLRQSLSATCAP